MTLGPTAVLLIVALALLGWLIGKRVYAFDDKVERRREDAMDAIQVLAAYGFKKLPSLLGKYAVGDYDGAWAELKRLCKDYADPKNLEHDLEGVFAHQLESKAKNEDTRQALYEKFEKLKVQYPPKQAVPPAATPVTPA